MAIPCIRTDELSEIREEFKEINTRLAVGDEQLKELKVIKKLIMSSVGVVIIQIVTMTWFFAGDHFLLQHVADVQKDMAPKVAKLWWAHEKDFPK